MRTCCRLCGCCACAFLSRKRLLSCTDKAKATVDKRFLALYAATFLILLPLACFNMKNSVYFVSYDEDGVKQSLWEENSRRLEDAQRYLDMLDKTKLHRMLQDFTNHHKSGSLSVAITIITVSRNRQKVDGFEPKYLTQVAWKFLSQLHSVKAEGFSHQVFLSICNVDFDPNSYDEAAYISQFIPMFQRFNKTHLSMVHVLEKEKQDYIFCLNRSLENHPDYVLLVEDDALPTSDFFHVLDHTLTTHVHRRYVRGEFVPQFDNIAYVKFYHPEWLLSFWSLDKERIPELIALTILLTMLLFCVFLPWFGNGKWTFVWLFIYSFLVVAAIGRSNWTKLRTAFSPHLYSFSSAPSCCTPAMLFPFDGAQHVISYLDKARCENNFGKDTVLDNLLRDKGMSAFLVQPNAFTHIGLFSSLRERIVNPFRV